MINNFSNIQSIRWVDEEKSAVYLQLDYGNETHDFVATANDCMDYGRELYQNAVNGLYGKIKAYLPPSAEELEYKRITDNVENNANLVKKEMAIALEVNDDYRLGIDVTDEQMTAVKTYIKAIRAKEYKSGEKAINLDRPEIMSNYD